MDGRQKQASKGGLGRVDERQSAIGNEERSRASSRFTREELIKQTEASGRRIQEQRNERDGRKALYTNRGSEGERMAIRVNEESRFAPFEGLWTEGKTQVLAKRKSEATLGISERPAQRRMLTFQNRAEDQAAKLPVDNIERKAPNQSRPEVGESASRLNPNSPSSQGSDESFYDYESKMGTVPVSQPEIIAQRLGPHIGIAEGTKHIFQTTRGDAEYQTGNLMYLAEYSKRIVDRMLIKQAESECLLRTAKRGMGRQSKSLGLKIPVIMGALANVPEAHRSEIQRYLERLLNNMESNEKCISDALEASKRESIFVEKLVRERSIMEQGIPDYIHKEIPPFPFNPIRIGQIQFDNIKQAQDFELLATKQLDISDPWSVNLKNQDTWSEFIRKERTREEGLKSRSRFDVSGAESENEEGAPSVPASEGYLSPLGLDDSSDVSGAESENEEGATSVPASEGHLSPLGLDDSSDDENEQDQDGRIDQYEGVQQGDQEEISDEENFRRFMAFIQKEMDEAWGRNSRTKLTDDSRPEVIHNTPGDYRHEPLKADSPGFRYDSESGEIY